MHKLISFLLLFAPFALETQAQSTVISGIAPSYVGQEIEIYEIEDYFSLTERLLASAKVLPDSTFSISFTVDHTQKVVIKSVNNSSHLYVEPNAKYSVFFPERDKYSPYNPNGNQVELSFLQLDSTDINYKILGFQRWIDRFVGNNFYLTTIKPEVFMDNLDHFKRSVEAAYINDTSSYFKTYVRFSVAGLDNIGNAAERNRYEKHDFYIKHTAVQYENDAYMDYVKSFYQELIPRLSTEANDLVYKGVIKSSPSMIMNALGTEYTLINRRIREMVMVNALAEVYHSGRYPQTNILTILDSVENHALFKNNSIIARNLKNRLTALVPGGKAPDFVLASAGKPTKTLLSFEEKYVYLHFANPNELSSLKELELLKDIHKRYGKYVEFITIYKDGNNLDAAGVKLLESLDWSVYKIASGNSIWKNYRVESFPLYTLIDGTGGIVASPALGPLPNGQYETIDKTFFHLKERIESQNKGEQERYNRND